MIEKNKVISVVCNDAGGANIIISWLKHNNYKCRPFMSGPSVSLWKAAFPDLPILESLDKAIDNSDVLLAGTGWMSCVEFDAIAYAHQKGVHAIAMIDHWVNYPERFIRGHECVRPNEIWVADHYAFKIAEREFPNIELQEIQNHYIDDGVKLLKGASGKGVLFIGEPIRLEAKGELISPFYLLEKLAMHFEDMGIDQRVILRPHPSEDRQQYIEFVKHNKQFDISLNADLFEDIRAAKTVFGFESMALVIAMQAGRKVISCLPSWFSECKLPHEGIIHLKDIVAW